MALIAEVRACTARRRSGLGVDASQKSPGPVVGANLRARPALSRAGVPGREHAHDAGVRAEFEIYERTETETSPRGKVKLPWHDAIHKLFERPNTQDGFGDLLEQSVQQISLTGISLTWAVPNKAGDEPQEIYSIPSATAWPMPPSGDYPFGAYRVLPYAYGFDWTFGGHSTLGAVIPAEQIKVVKKPHPLLRHDGYAVLTAISHHVDTVDAIDKSRFATQTQGPQQTVGFELPDGTNLDEAAMTRYRTQLKALYGGPDKAGEFLIAYGGARFRQISTAPAEMMWQEGWTQLVDFILAAYGVPRSVAGLQQDTSYATLYASLRAFVILSLGPLLDRFAQGWTRHLIQPTYGDEFGLLIRPKEFKDESLLEQQIGNDLKAGAILVEELRDLRGRDKLNADEDKWLRDRASQNFQLAPGDGGPPPGGSQQKPTSATTQADPATDNARPVSPGSKSNGHAREELLTAFERAKTNGHAKAITG
jgi:hypothetical protein